MSRRKLDLEGFSPDAAVQPISAAPADAAAAVHGFTSREAPVTPHTLKRRGRPAKGHERILISASPEDIAIFRGIAEERGVLMGKLFSDMIRLYKKHAAKE